ncbi:hypothetical protein AW40_26970 [Kosakonia radicincitans UMEnt01/12]|uniref:hypothetical protein n=1 Tax=Kosakonia radicincitans TaxID=283686 RepID=UPI000460DE3E|nr:hypothetical protein [Kosakonia radicincitans]KDE33505.1 hypothetical protein AW40_26970 [Kosakonia radicincitans UMEnt01/12]
MAKIIDKAKAMAAAQRSEDFWSTIDGDKLAKVGLLDKDMDLVGPRKKSQTRLVARKGSTPKIIVPTRVMHARPGVAVAKKQKLKVG